MAVGTTSSSLSNIIKGGKIMPGNRGMKKSKKKKNRGTKKK